MDPAIFYPFYRLTPGPHVSPHSCFLQKQSSSAVSQMMDSKLLFCSLLSSFLLRTKNGVPLFNLPMWLSGLDSHQSQEHPGCNSRCSLNFFYGFFFSVTYFILVLKRKTRSRRIEQERKKGEQIINILKKRIESEKECTALSHLKGNRWCGDTWGPGLRQYKMTQDAAILYRHVRAPVKWYYHHLFFLFTDQSRSKKWILKKI
jgi:hypothetical protein